jgi:hypothetical protein
VKPASDAAKGELATGLAVEDDVSGFHHVEKVLVPQLHLDDPPSAFHRRRLGQLFQIAVNGQGNAPIERIHFLASSAKSCRAQSRGPPGYISSSKNTIVGALGAPTEPPFCSDQNLTKVLCFSLKEIS